jgi:hypothetical protein
MLPQTQLLDLQRRWTPPHGLQHSPPREVGWTAAGWGLATVSAVLIVVGLAAGIGLYVTAARQQDERLRLREHGVDTDGGVTRLWMTKGKQPHHWVEFQFVAGERRVDGRLEVPRRTWSTLQRGSPIPVRYDPSDPAAYALFGRDRRAIDLWVSYLVGLVLAACGCLATVPVISEQRLLADGRPAPGLVTKRYKVHHAHGGSHDEVLYEFLLMNGAARAGKGPGRSLQVGEPICVLYEPDNPSRNALFPLSLVRPATMAEGSTA